MGKKGDLLDLLRARLFRLVHRGTPGDVAFYCDRTRYATRVLELGCGAGRILGPIAEQGTSVVGIERSPFMLAAGQDTFGGLPPHSRVELGDMRTFRFPEPFDTVIIPYNTLFAMETDDDIRACLARVHEQLVPDGRLYLDCYVLNETGQSAPSPFRKIDTILDGGRRIEVWEQEGPELPGRRFEMRYRYRIQNPDGVARIETDVVCHHYAPPDVLLELLDEAGFEITARHGDFDRSPFGPDSVIMVVEARRRG